MSLTVHGITLDTFTTEYLAAMLWSSVDDGEFDHVAIVDLPVETINSAVADCAKFQASPAWQTALEADSERDDMPYASDGTGMEGQGGHDFWLTRCGHGAGFWDGDWPQPYDDALDAVARQFGNIDPYMGDDGQVYFA